MKSLLGKKWHRVPAVLLVVLLIAVLTTGAVLAAEAYPFKTFTTAVTVAEPMVVEYNLQGNYGGDSEWHPLGDEDSLTIEGSAGDIFALDLRFKNLASEPLTIGTVITGGGDGDVTGEGFPDALVVEGDPSPWVEVPVSVNIQGTAAPRLYNVTFSFTRF